MAMNNLLEKARKIYGGHNLGFIGSPLEGSKYDDVEIILHELCHQVFLDVKCSIGDMNWTFDHMVKLLGDKPKWIADLHEIRTAAAELLVAKKLGLKIPHDYFCLIVSKNLESEAIKNLDYDERKIKVKKLINKAKRTEKVKFAAAQVVALFEMVKI